ncbi:MAG: SDR family oxidoreductase [Candidatus Dadabacteria bacterium]|nr:MAG: SDR family oxidoreductase [Candidatus Dadabacteria bacterium]
MTLINYKSQVALITGASSGIGAEFARQLHLRGASVVLVARRAKRLERLASELNAVRPNSAEILVADLSRIEEGNESFGINRVVKYIETHRIDILVNNAGFGSFGTFYQLPLTREIDMLGVNVTAPTLLTHAALQQMIPRKSGSIIYVSSVAGIQPLPYMSTYAATKAYDLFHALGLYFELKREGIRVLAVCPGPVETEFSRAANIPDGSRVDVRRDEVTDVVNESLQALEKERSLVFPCFRPKIFRFLCALVPLTVRSWLVGSVLRPGRS